MYRFLISLYSDGNFNIAVTDNQDPSAILELVGEIIVCQTPGNLERAFAELTSYCEEHSILEMNVTVLLQG